MCNLTCPPGHIVNTTSCDECIFTSICDRDRPCKNGGNCIQYSPATNYTCDCTGFYTGYNCSGILKSNIIVTLLLSSDCSLTCSSGYVPNLSCTKCEFVSICDRDGPCQNGGNCIQYSPATNYTCHCTGFYTGYNCSGILKSNIIVTLLLSSDCSLTCSSGYVPNSSCTKCDFVSICDRDGPCQNGGNCIQYSPATNYTCHCTGLYTGYNCSGTYCTNLLNLPFVFKSLLIVVLSWLYP